MKHLSLFLAFILCIFLLHAYSNTTNSKNEESFYIDVLHRGRILSRNDCPRIRGAKKCPIENFNTYSKASPVEVGNYIYMIFIKFSNI